jgi:iron complex outermembrane receptor protein
MIVNPNGNKGETGMLIKWKLTWTESAVSALVAAALMAPLASGAALAQVEEIVVVAQKRSQNIQDVPIAITAITSKALQQSVPEAAAMDLGMVTPGLQTQQVVAGYVARIRGIGQTDTTPGNESSVSIYVDGVYEPGSTAGALLGLSNIDRG